jgi:hypothetical protein
MHAYSEGKTKEFSATSSADSTHLRTRPQQRTRGGLFSKRTEKAPFFGTTTSHYSTVSTKIQSLGSIHVFTIKKEAQTISHCLPFTSLLQKYILDNLV